MKPGPRKEPQNEAPTLQALPGIQCHSSKWAFPAAGEPLAAELGIGSERVSTTIVANDDVADRVTDRQCRVSYRLEIGVSDFLWHLSG